VVAAQAVAAQAVVAQPAVAQQAAPAVVPVRPAELPRQAEQRRAAPA
jgi:hypothetical protein